jgi:hypothetical protein
VTLTVLVIGGYGTFGGRIVAMLAGTPDLRLIVAGRSRAKASAFCAGRAGLEPACFDRAGAISAQLSALAPHIVIDASGPFQAYGPAPYAMPHACIALGIHYIDLADDAAYVAGITRLAMGAAAAGVFVIAGASSFPALTVAVARMLAAPMARVEAITAGVAPSPRAPLGENVLRAIASYAGRRIDAWRDGGAAQAYGLTEQRRLTIALPGGLPLRRRRFALVEVPETRLMPAVWPGLREVWVGAATRPAVLQAGLVAAAWLVRFRILPGLGWAVPLMLAARRRLRWGAHRGGMVIELRGSDAAGQKRRRRWFMLAEGDTGPLIPAIPAVGLIRRVLAGKAPAAGARAAWQDVSLDDYAPLFAAHGIRTGIRDGGPGPLYARVLGSAWEDLPPPLRAMHDITGTAVAEGWARVDRGRGMLARLAAAVIGFPAAADRVPVRVEFSLRDGVETWTRQFGTRRFASDQYAGTGAEEGLIWERFGRLRFAMALVSEPSRLSLVLCGWRAFGVPLPLFLAPRGTAFESVEDGQFQFHVEISHPLTGLIVRYRGGLTRR